MFRRNKYHTSIKIAYKLNLLPKELCHLIPKSTLYRFRSSDFSDIFGMEYGSFLSDNQALLQDLLKSNASLSITRAILRIKNTIITITQGALSEFEKMKAVIKTIHIVKPIIGLDRACRLFSLSRSVYYSWFHQISHRCFDSFIGKCVRRWPNQLSISTLNTMKNLRADTRFKGWPLASIALFAKRSGKISASLQTWYKYAPLLGIGGRPPHCKKKRKLGIRASSPHQIWHADVSVFRTLDNVKTYIYLVVDNFSRCILSWRVSLKLCAKTRLDTIEEAYFKYIHTTPLDCMLLVDGGSENNNVTVDDFLDSPGVSLRKIIAQRDIHFSNSMVEAVNKIVKYRSLFLQDIPDIDALQKHMEEFVPVYNSIRPHVSLKGLTPSEVLSGMVPENADDLRKAGLIASQSNFQRENHVTCTACIDENDTFHE